ncbi:hypothetical protein [Dickeya undicola]|uniref:Uncharacterized protein n=1 Tax=Dickeya undicola TaxID=1577887 RepID=A0A3N0FQG0_9GAMM|nr:hypothetical protein [Dickeya undicola]RNM02389.1 hypothetical protein EF878_20175 [Dickeya undicola]
MSQSVDHQKWIQRCRDIVFKGESRAQSFWERAALETREIILFSAKPKLKSRHVNYSWHQFTAEERAAIWGAIKRIRAICDETALFGPDDFLKTSNQNGTPNKLNQSPIH